MNLKEVFNINLVTTHFKRSLVNINPERFLMCKLNEFVLSFGLMEIN